MAPRASLVDGARDQLLAGAALAADEHRDVGVGDAIDEVVDLAHLVAAAEQLADDTSRTRATGFVSRDATSGRGGDGGIACRRVVASSRVTPLPLSKASATREIVWLC